MAHSYEFSQISAQKITQILNYPKKMSPRPRVLRKRICLEFGRRNKGKKNLRAPELGLKVERPPFGSLRAGEKKGLGKEGVNVQIQRK
jgi:hypothetical protein